MRLQHFILQCTAEYSLNKTRTNPNSTAEAEIKEEYVCKIFFSFLYRCEKNIMNPSLLRGEHFSLARGQISKE